MRKLMILAVLLSLLAIPVHAMDLEPPDVPSYAEPFMPREPQNLQEGIREIIVRATEQLRPDLKEAAEVCVSMTAVVIVMTLMGALPGNSGQTRELVGSLSVSSILLHASGSMINLAADTVYQLSQYGKLLIPVLTAALAAQGGINASTTIYTGTAMFDAVLSSAISHILIPMLYVHLSLAIAGSALRDERLRKIRDAMKWLMNWTLKIILYVFTGYITVTGVISGVTDASALKAAKLTISGMVPVVGGILSDASEAILVSAGMVKNAVGLYGLFAVLAIWLGPFLKIGAHFMMFRLTELFCGFFCSKNMSDLIQDFANAFGLMLAMIGSVCLMLMISLICFMKGVG